MNVKVGIFSSGKQETVLQGVGWVLFEMPVPFEAIHRIYLNNSIVHVSIPKLVLLRRGPIQSSAEKITTPSTGEVTTSVFAGTGELWLAPSAHIPYVCHKATNESI